MNQQRNKVNNEMGATETEKATQGTETSSTGTGRKVTPPTLAQQWEDLGAEFEGEAIECGEEDAALIAVEIRHAVHEGLSLWRLAGAAARIASYNSEFIKARLGKHPDRVGILTALDQVVTAAGLLGETTGARNSEPESSVAPVRTEPLERSTPDHLVNIVSLTTVLSDVGCNAPSSDVLEPLASAYEAGAHALASVNQNGMRHRSARASTVDFAGFAAEVLGSLAREFSGTPEKRDLDRLNTMLSLAEDIATLVRSVRDAAIAAEVST